MEMLNSAFNSRWPHHLCAYREPQGRGGVSQGVPLQVHHLLFPRSLEEDKERSWLRENVGLPGPFLQQTLQVCGLLFLWLLICFPAWASPRPLTAANPPEQL